MLKSFLYLSVFAVLVFTLSVQDAHATTFTAVTGNWDDPATWGGTVPGQFDSVEIPNGETVTIRSSGGANFNHMRVLEGGTLINHGTINNFGIIILSGTINSDKNFFNGVTVGGRPGLGQLIIFDPGKLFLKQHGFFVNNAKSTVFIQDTPFTNSVGELNNAGDFTNENIIYNNGNFINSGFISNDDAKIFNYGTIINGNGISTDGEIENSLNSIIYNNGATIHNTSTIKNNGIIDNNNGIITNNVSTVDINNPGIITNTNKIFNIGGTIKNYCPSVITPMMVSSGNAIINISCSSSPFIDYAAYPWIIMISSLVFPVGYALYSAKF